MNTKPDDTRLAQWVEDELTGAELDQVERWAAGQAEWLARREESRAWRTMMRRALPVAEEPPYLEFFQTRIERAVRTAAAEANPTPATNRSGSRWSPLWLPLAAAAGMTLCFWAGTRFATPATPQAVAVSAERSPATSVYVPEQGVKAKVYESEESTGVVIVLDGVKAIPDALEIPEQAGPPAGRERSSSTAAAETNPDSAKRRQ